MKIAIAGAGRVGTVITQQLVKEHHDIIVVDKSDVDIDNIANSLDVLTYVGDASSAQVLTDAGVPSCELLIAVTDSDSVNLLICIIAKKMGVQNTIARIREPIYVETINLIKEDMGLSFFVNPERDAAKEIIGSLMFKGAGQVETFAQSSNEVMTFSVREKNPIVGMAIKDLSKFINRKILICAIKREGEVFIPNGATVIQVGDTISFVATRADSVHFFKKMKYETGKSNDLTIIGGGRLGYYLAHMAIANGISVKIIDNDPEKCRKLNEDIPYAEILCGDGTQISTLEECGVFQSSAVATTTGSDEKNVLISMYLVKRYPDIKVITKLKKSDFEDMLYGIDLGNVFNPKYIAADRIITYVRAMQETIGNDVQSVCHVIDNKVEVLEFRIDQYAENIGIPFQNIRFHPNILVASITRDGRSFIPGGNDAFLPGDTVLITTTNKNIRTLREIFA